MACRKFLAAIAFAAAWCMGVGAQAHDASKYPDWKGRWLRTTAGTFDPDRFLPGRLSEAQARAWVPFGLGQHLCVGRDFAVLEMHIVLATS